MTQANRIEEMSTSTVNEQNMRAASGSNVEEQFSDLLAQIESKLAAAGLEWTDIVHGWVRLGDMGRDFPAYNKLWREHFTQIDAGFYPCRTTVSVGNLPDGVFLEMDVIARKKDASYTLRNSPRAPDAVGAYSHALQFDDRLYVAGIGPRKKGDTAIPGSTVDENGKQTAYEVEPQCVSVLDNIGYILEDAGFEWKDLKSGRFYLTDMNDLPALKKVWAEYFATRGNPSFDCLELFEVSALPTPINAEMDCILEKKG